MKQLLKNGIARLLFAYVLITFFSCNNPKETSPDRKMPGGPVPEMLYVSDVKEDMSWADKNMLSCFQGLVNRKKTRINYNGSADDLFWLEYYKKSFGIGYQKVSGMEELLHLFSKEIDGYIVYPPESPHLLNIATTIGSLENLLPVTPAQEELLKKIGLTKKKELNDNGKDMIGIIKEQQPEDSTSQKYPIQNIDNLKVELSLIQSGIAV